MGAGVWDAGPRRCRVVIKEKRKTKEEFLAAKTPHGTTELSEGGSVPRFLRYAARRARVRRGRKDWAVAVPSTSLRASGMTRLSVRTQRIGIDRLGEGVYTVKAGASSRTPSAVR